MRLSVRHGSCVTTAYAYSGFGYMLAFMGERSEGFRFSQLAEKQIKDNLSLPGTKLMVHGFLQHLKRPAVLSLDPFLKAYRVGLETGDMFYGSLCLTVYSLLYIFSGLPLAPFVSDMKSFARQLVIWQQHTALVFLAPQLLLALNLMGDTKVPGIITWDACRNEKVSGADVVVDEESQAFLTLSYAQLLVSYILGDLARAEETFQVISGIPMQRFPGTHFSNYFMAFLDGLLMNWLQRERPGVKKYRRSAQKAIKELTGYAKTGSVDCVGMLKLLQAEQSALPGKKGVPELAVREMYNEAIIKLSRSGMSHHAAIANECAGEHLFRQGDHQGWGDVYLSRAIDLYQEWGATVKVEHLRAKYPSIRSSEDLGTGKTLPSVGIRGKKRFDLTKDSLAPSRYAYSPPFE